jgi:hypothetical protein
MMLEEKKSNHFKYVKFAKAFVANVGVVGARNGKTEATLRAEPAG